ncbi:MAG: hypothetical protein A2339_01755 [Elusimicrobia bacterium RIFOXYB12_FULL_50_12]|nr:MAG: hypothetical protein A2278_04105 [Elusimicrobia bacterium RIFOXYA12_FULL_49_49]OGS10724.1 MAG: hypothetical protein A2386_03970 [Elusimicrobia bacterium RIFOXYB1_FULL_48_9]OGS15342.1 MAG: hypothetical protein A2251_07420 [Elusimicrobia bacterium RIFOXYA2_FULL_47_53]OGS26472.1 MAG: hypothetical protein A2339_01755 [Elusimicrobia bacterium RIFOXYB12_FULL_50_12]OGS30597.1 MAG: hypothetical protein A2323_02540 [Elusimicrobia bacterium RIFOXYB2_FULL_46_23]
MGAILVIGLLFLYHLPSLSSKSLAALNEKLKAVTLLSEPAVAKAVSSKDDIALFSEIEKISKVEDISSAYMLDNSARVTIHNNTAQWGSELSDEYSKKAVASPKTIIQKLPSANKYLYSSRVASSATLCIEVSSQRMKDFNSSESKKALYTAAIVIVVYTLLMIVIVNRFVKIPVQKFEQAAASLISGGAADYKGEYDSIFEKIKAFAVEKSSGRSAGGADASEIIGFGLNAWNIGILAVDSQNKVVYINETAGDLLGIIDGESLKGKHLLDAVPEPELLEVIKKSKAIPNQTAETKYKEKTAKAVSRESGTAVLFI